MKCEEVKGLLEKKERANLGFYPTPFYKLGRLSDKLGINLYIKREDFSGQPLFGGNKKKSVTGRIKIAGHARIACRYLAQ